MDRIRPELGKALLRAQSILAAQEGVETKSNLKRPRSVVDIIEAIEARGLPTDLSPRQRKPMDLPGFGESRPRVSSLPVPAARPRLAR